MGNVVDTGEFARAVVNSLAIAVLIEEHPQREAIQQRIRTQVQGTLASSRTLSDEQRAELAQAAETALREIGA
ncbi:MAG: hypothetical protein ACREP4_01115 [Stenotrophomonas sp.]|uniref:hypothetical protein n=1 Tax=Stenotrophomonas sp. TaxID=69392 RepID=UPI003D6D124D